jgi:fumarylacetoacetate (FAA) hydrolase family protein
MVRPQVPYPSGKNLFFGLGWMIMPELSNGEYDSGVVQNVRARVRMSTDHTDPINLCNLWTKVVSSAFPWSLAS